VALREQTPDRGIVFVYLRFPPGDLDAEHVISSGPGPVINLARHEPIARLALDHG
jgi:hypothetical protein